MQNNINTTNQNAKSGLLKAKNLINTTNKLLANRANKDLMQPFDNLRFSKNYGQIDSIESIGQVVPSIGAQKPIRGYKSNISTSESGKELKSFEGHANSVEPEAQPIIVSRRSKPTRSSINKVFGAVGEVADSVGEVTTSFLTGIEMLNIHLRAELVNQKITVVKELALKFGITEAEAQRLIDEA